MDESNIRGKLAQREEYTRPEDQTFLTLPEWLIVYSADEQGAFLKEHPAQDFPWFKAIHQFWTVYRSVYGATRDRYEFNIGYHAMIWTIGTSYTVEMAAKGLWENTVGRLTTAVSGSEPTPEEQWYAEVIADYGAFVHHTPFYAFPFAARRGELWSAGVNAGHDEPMTFRRWERRFTYAAELTLRSVWGQIMGWMSGTAYGEETGVVFAWANTRGADLSDLDVTVVESFGGDQTLLRVPRYEPFTATAQALADRGVELVEIAGGSVILVQLVADESWDEAHLWGDPFAEWPILTQPGKKRVTLQVPVRRLDEVLSAWKVRGIQVEHLYDY